LSVESSNQGALGLVAGFRIVAGLPGAQMSRGDGSKGVAVGFQRVNLCGMVEQSGDREVESVPTTQDFIAKVIGSPVFSLVGQDDETGDGAVVAVTQAVE